MSFCVLTIFWGEGLLSNFFISLQIRNEWYSLQSGAKDALLNAFLLAAKRFSSALLRCHFRFNHSWCALTVSAEILNFFKQLLTQICLVLSTLVLLAAEHGKPIGNLWYCLQNLQSQHNEVLLP